MNSLLRNRTVGAAVVVFGGFALLRLVTPDPYVYTLAEVVNAVLLAVSSAVVVMYLPVLVTTIKESRYDAIYYQVIAIWLVWCSLAGRGFLGLWWRFHGMPSDWPNGFWWLLNLFVAVVAGTLFITAPGTSQGVVPPRNWMIWGIAVALGVGVGALIVMFSGVSGRD